MALQLLEPVPEAVYGNRPEDGRYTTRYLEVAQYVFRLALDAGWGVRYDRQDVEHTVRWWRC